jgi:hypothetical protein
LLVKIIEAHDSPLEPDQADQCFELFKSWLRKFVNTGVDYRREEYQTQYYSIYHYPLWRQAWNAQTSNPLNDNKFKIWTMQCLLEELKQDVQVRKQRGAAVMDIEVFILRLVPRIDYDPHAFLAWLQYVPSSYRVRLFLRYHMYMSVDDWLRFFKQLEPHSEWRPSWVLEDGHLLNRAEPELCHQLPSLLIRTSQDARLLFEAMESFCGRVDVSIDPVFFKHIMNMLDPQRDAHTAYRFLQRQCFANLRTDLLEWMCETLYRRFPLRNSMAFVCLDQWLFDVCIDRYYPSAPSQLHHRRIQILYIVMKYDPRPVTSVRLLDNARNIDMIHDVNLWLRVFSSMHVPSGHWFERVRRYPRDVESELRNHLPHVLAHMISELI